MEEKGKKVAELLRAIRHAKLYAAKSSGSWRASYLLREQVLKDELKEVLK